MYHYLRAPLFRLSFHSFLLLYPGAGDYIITRHSNLPSCHIIIHLVVDGNPAAAPVNAAAAAAANASGGAAAAAAAAASAASAAACLSQLNSGISNVLKFCIRSGVSTIAMALPMPPIPAGTDSASSLSTAAQGSKQQQQQQQQQSGGNQRPVAITAVLSSAVVQRITAFVRRVRGTLIELSADNINGHPDCAGAAGSAAGDARDGGEDQGGGSQPGGGHQGAGTSGQGSRSRARDGAQWLHEIAFLVPTASGHMHSQQQPKSQQQCNASPSQLAALARVGQVVEAVFFSA